MDNNMKKNRRENFMAGCIIGGCAIVMVLALVFTLADVASKPAVHTASYAVLQTSPPESPLTTPDQGRATFVSLSGLAAGHLISEVIR